jgi:predicted ATPase
MLLKSLKIERLYGTLDMNVQFKKDVTLLVGINGCGKTSVLNVIDWLLRPDIKSLALTDFSQLVLDFDYKEKAYSLKAQKTENKLVLSIEGAEINVTPITVNLVQSKFATDEEFITGQYDRLLAEEHELPMIELIKSFSKPTVISLDRTISAEVDNIFYLDPQRNDIRKKSRRISPLTHAQEVTSEKYAEYRTKAIQHDNELKARIVMSALRSPEDIFQGRPLKPMRPYEIKQLEEKVITYLSASVKIDGVTKQVRSFFNSSKLLTQSTKNAPEYLINFVLAQYHQLDDLAKAFNDFEVKNAEAFKHLKDYLDAVNRFFNDSGKELYFDDSTGRLLFLFKGSSENERVGRTINHLSSGEKQILILFTFLAFISKDHGVFIVDEPELSLHPKWQSEFMDSFLQLCPPYTQLLLATHSPDIVGKHKSSCISLVRGA